MTQDGVYNTRNSGQVITARISDDLYREISDYADSMEIKTISEAIRLLIANGLEIGGHSGMVDRTVAENAKAVAISRLYQKLNPALNEFAKEALEE
jgi:hypothetical protein